jgi:serine/threonine protein kinase
MRRDDDGAERITHDAEPAVGATRTHVTGAAAPSGEPVAPPSSTFAKPRDPDRYRIIDEHGRGGLGRVSRAHDTELGRDIAIKESLSRRTLHEARFLREALITARLEHPGIVPVYEAGYWPDGTPFYAMKLISGRPLAELIAERPTVAGRIGLLHHVIAVADTMAYAHAQRVIHRDLKPSNIIVGNYGETIIIDWGIAKDISAGPEAEISLGSPATRSGDGLTSAGTVLGTPDYMAPEQARGEAVDQRADVYAIGAMLWELCCLERVPPAEPAARREALRGADIDADLVTIVDKALQQDPPRRYPDAGALAADLKSFKAGNRIAARSYSPAQLLWRWVRHHRALAASLAIGALAVLGLGLYHLETITREKEHAEAARASMKAALDEVLLKNAQLLLGTDPSAALDVVRTYKGNDTVRVRQIEAEAVGLGVAKLRAAPHLDMVLWAAGRRNGDVVSLSRDGTIAKTSPRGETAVLARNVAAVRVFSYAHAAGILAYACDADDVCLWDVERDRPLQPWGRLARQKPAVVSLSPSGLSLAVLSQRGTIEVFRTVAGGDTAPVRAVSAPEVDDVVLLDDDAFLISTTNDVELAYASGAPSHRLAIRDNSQLAGDPDTRRAAIGTVDGHLHLVDVASGRALADHAPCTTPVGGLAFIGRDRIAYTCRGGEIGVLDLASGRRVLSHQLVGRAGLVGMSAASDHLVAAGDHGSALWFDVEAGAVAVARGHDFQLSFLGPPTPAFPFLITGDSRGFLRVWPLPPRLTRVIASSPARFYNPALIPQTDDLVATSGAAALAHIAPTGSLERLTPHDPSNTVLEASPDGAELVAYGSDKLEVWGFAPLRPLRTVVTGHGTIPRAYFARTGDLVTAGQDGRIVRWDRRGVGTPIAQLASAVDEFAIVPSTGALIVATADGALWRVDPKADPKADPTHAAHRLAAPVARIGTLVTDGDTVYAGFASGDLVAYDAAGAPTILVHVDGVIADLAVRSHVIAFATSKGDVYIGQPGDVPGLRSWTRLAVPGRSMTVTQDGIVIAACSSGEIWIYSSRDRTWLDVPTGAVSYTTAIISHDQSRLFVVDSQGHILQIDLTEVRKQLSNTSNG